MNRKLITLPSIASLFFVFLFSLFPLSLYAQRKNTAYLEYIQQYHRLAVDQMKDHHIPASITLAQGLLESGAGRSELARRSNNHFGIKCGGDWRGRTVRHDDDAHQECFRAYKDPRDSYEDHSLFLKRSRYATLFKLDITDYRSWARELKRAGYATDPSYANRLITIIEDYELYRYDTRPGRFIKEVEDTHYVHTIGIANDIAYVIAQDGDTFQSLSKELGISARKLIKYNELSKDYPISKGDVLYLKSKKKKAPKNYVVHVVAAGESMYLISQKYGMRLKSLYKLNRKDSDYLPEVGDRLRLR